MAGVVVAAAGPFGADGEAVLGEGVFVSAPHVCCGVVLPAFVGVGECVEDLEGFDSLFAEALAVEDAGGLGEVGVWEECLHGGLSFRFTWWGCCR